jgi:hypothetical protein
MIQAVLIDAMGLLQGLLGKGGWSNSSYLAIGHGQQKDAELKEGKGENGPGDIV